MDDLLIKPYMTVDTFIRTFCLGDTNVFITDSMEEETTTISYEGPVKDLILYPDENTTILGKIVESIDVTTDTSLFILIES